MRVLVIGAEGQLGAELRNVYAGDDCVGADLDGGGYLLDVCDASAVHRCIVQDIRPELVINAAAAHHVPDCENNPGVAFAVNAIGARGIAIACHEAHARLVHVSTDYVFGNGQTRPYIETDMPAPLNVYGVSKLAGEHLIAAECPDYLIVRAAALYGAAPCRAKGGRNFVQTMLHLAASSSELRVVADEITTPTAAMDLARQIRHLAERGQPGLYHATSQGACSWYEFAQAIFDEIHLDVRLTPAAARDVPAAVKRPQYSVLENRHAQEQGLDIMPPWREALRAYLMTLPATG